MLKTTRMLPTPAFKILSDTLDMFEYRDKVILYGGRRVRYVEIAGICIEMGRKFMRVLDFCGEVFMTRDDEHAMAATSHVFLCRLYYKDGTVRLHCQSVKKIDVFEEVFFWAEAVNLRKQKAWGREVQAVQNQVHRIE